MFVVECDGTIDPAEVAEGLRRQIELAPWLGGRLERPFPWGRLRWTIEMPVPDGRRPTVTVREAMPAPSSTST
jgi:hypothetical protein